MGTIGLWGILVIVGVIVLLFGARRLPDIARGLGRSSREFKDALTEAPENFREGANEDEETSALPPSDSGKTARELELERQLEEERARRSETQP
jgi:sec-independent protein translocase protein TatA